MATWRKNWLNYGFLCLHLAATCGAASAQAPSIFPQQTGERASHTEPGPQYEINPQIQLHVQPLLRSHVVDKVSDPTTVSIDAKEPAQRVELYLEPVDAPYGGKTVGPSRLIGKSDKSGRKFTFNWTDREPYRYVRLFALVYRNGNDSPEQSSSLDLGMAGARRIEEPPSSGGSPPPSPPAMP